MIGFFRYLTLLLLLTVFVGATAAEEISRDKPVEILVLTNGDRLSGQSLDFDGQGILWRFPHGGEIVIPLALIESFETMEPLVPEAKEQTATPSPISTALHTTEELPTGESTGHDTASEIEQVLHEEDIPFSAGEAVYRFLWDSGDWFGEEISAWTKSFELGGAWTDGNSRTSTLTSGGSFEREYSRITSKLTWGGRYTTAQGVATDNRWWANSTFDYDYEGDWFFFTTTRHEYNEFKDLKYRGTYSGGIGYRFVKEKDRRIIARLGPAVTLEYYDEPTGARQTPDMFGEFEIVWPMHERVDFELTSAVTPSMNDVSIFRMTNTSGLILHLDDRDKWAFRLGLRHEYDSQPNGDLLPNDITTTMQLVYHRNGTSKVKRLKY
ncbi:DUF481 domain-containing protein [Calycomorphotria hydatis]|uniref:DUF481 domain-containing protein n=1 Tax=Calycomorphotria hydatis TaxID=2528027 RepID=A0A517T8G2_9PLAN|nr:DUF481 domain-containing protein [Calycomorphotria hydatis]QDT64649.1 hypothetical protein V22_18890 [Calycomorphotria hydatis]